jgi:hypothetical protein
MSFPTNAAINNGEKPPTPTTDKIIILYEGHNYLWPVRNGIEFSIVEHENHNCIEVVSYQRDPELFEAPRLYIHSDVLYSKISPYEIEARVESMVEELNSMNKRMSKAALPLKAKHKIATEVILSRVTINTSKSVDKFLDGRFSVFLTPLEGDKLVKKRIDIMWPMKDAVSEIGISPYSVPAVESHAAPDARRTSSIR